MNVYADQNLIIRSRDSEEANALVTEAHKAGVATFVLSPIHFYEIGTVRDDEYEATIHFVEELKPVWALGRVDLLLREFAAEWNRFWKLSPYEFQPIGDLAHAASAMHRRPPELFSELSSREFIQPFRNEKEKKRSEEQFLDLQFTFGQNSSANEENRMRYKSGQITSAMLREVEKSYVALQLARIREEASSINELHMRAGRILRESDLFQRISIFVENGAFKRLKAHMVETLITLDSWQGNALLKENTQIDREHAIVALAYCDVFVTGDSRLQKICERVRARCTFPLARVVSVDDWIAELGANLRSA